MILLCKGRSVKIFILNLPMSSNPNYYGRLATFGKNFRNLISLLESELKRTVSEENVPFITIKSLLDENDFWDHCHNTASGKKNC